MAFSLSFINPAKNVRDSFSQSGEHALHDRAQVRELLERILKRNIEPFWYPRVIDQEQGGYRLHHDSRGAWKGPTGKFLVTQARTLWFFSRLGGSRYGGREHLDAARHGYRFLSEKLWDKRSGGFFWEIDRSAERVIKPQKNLYGQAFGLYALSEYAAASGDGPALSLARELFSLLQVYAHDPVYGGYGEFFLENWERAPGSMIGYCGVAAGTKSMNTHLHVMEAMTRYYRVTGDPAARTALLELVLILSNAVLRKASGACSDAHEQDWSPLHGPKHDRVSYGHDLENIWLLADACNSLSLPQGPFLDLYRTLFAKALQYGLDRKQGGFYESGPLDAPADNREKVWWVQAEALVSALYMYRIFGDDAYWNHFCRTLEYIARNQVDWVHGEWHANRSRHGHPSGDKAGEWKCPYHNGRAMLSCIDLLEFPGRHDHA